MFFDKMKKDFMERLAAECKIENPDYGILREALEVFSDTLAPLTYNSRDGSGTCGSMLSRHLEYLHPKERVYYNAVEYLGFSGKNKNFDSAEECFADMYVGGAEAYRAVAALKEMGLEDSLIDHAQDKYGFEFSDETKTAFKNANIVTISQCALIVKGGLEVPGLGLRAKEEIMQKLEIIKMPKKENPVDYNAELEKLASKLLPDQAKQLVEMAQRMLGIDR